MPDLTCPTVRIKTPAGDVVINESDFDGATMERADPVVPPPPPAAAIVPPPPPLDPLASLPADWRKSDGPGLKRLASVVSGRTVENVAQAVDVIEAALAARGTN